jgi:hypothetical protein
MNKQVAIKILQAARARIAKCWTQGTVARNKDGLRCNAWDADAASFCLLGSLVPSSMEVQGQDKHCEDSTTWQGVMQSLKETILPKWPSMVNLALWNDSPYRKLSEVLDVMDRTIARLQEEEQLPETD